MKGSEYRAMAAKTVAIHDVALPSGAVFKLKTPPLSQWVASGVLPLSLLTKMKSYAEKAAQGDVTEDAVNSIVASMTEEEFMVQIDLGKQMLKFAMVEPKLSLPGEPENDDAIGIAEIIEEDYAALMKWLWGGGAAGSTAAGFRTKGRKSTVGKPRR